MKKIALLLAGLMILAGCGAATTEEPTDELTTEEPVVSEEVETEVEVLATTEETVELEDLGTELED